MSCAMASNEEREKARQERLRRRRERDRICRPSEAPEERDARYHIRTPELNRYL